jgi:hypothetical protein
VSTSREWVDAEESELPVNDFIEPVCRDVGLEYIPKSAICVQKYYMRRALNTGLNTSVQKNLERLNDINRYILYIPEEIPKQLEQNETIEILDQVKVPEWREAVFNANIENFEISYDESVSYFKR